MTVVIAGGGLSGLTLAGHLALEPRWHERVAVVDDGSRLFAGMPVGEHVRDRAVALGADHQQAGSSGR